MGFSVEEVMRLGCEEVLSFKNKDEGRLGGSVG